MAINSVPMKLLLNTETQHRKTNSMKTKPAALALVLLLCVIFSACGGGRQ